MSGRSKDREQLDALFDTEDYEVRKLSKRLDKVVKDKRGNNVPKGKRLK